MADVPRHLRTVTGALMTAALLPVAFGSAATADQPTGSARSTPTIVGGERASIKDNPWVVYLTTANGFQFCGGTIASANKVITAAHCASANKPADMRVVAGRENKNSTDGTIAKVSSVWVHPNYQSADAGDDIAVLTLSGNLPNQPLPVAGQGDSGLYATGTKADILGWGNTSEGGEASQYLLKASVPITSDSACGQAYGSYNQSTMVCAGYDQGGTDTCQGDSGGPLVAGGKLIGVVSYGDGCAQPGKPGVYTRTARYQQLIAGQIGS